MKQSLLFLGKSVNRSLNLQLLWNWIIGLKICAIKLLNKKNISLFTQYSHEPKNRINGSKATYTNLFSKITRANAKPKLVITKTHCIYESQSCKKH